MQFRVGAHEYVEYVMVPGGYTPNICYDLQIRARLQRPRLLSCIHLALGTRIAGRTSSVQSSALQADVVKTAMNGKAKDEEDFVSHVQTVKSTVIP